MRIKTSNIYPPIPNRNFDWCAWIDGYEEVESLYGYGRTKEAALAELQEQINEEFSPCSHCSRQTYTPALDRHGYCLDCSREYWEDFQREHR